MNVPAPNPSPKPPLLPTIRGPIAGARCEECPLAGKDGNPVRPVPGEGAQSPAWIVVGEGPGRVEVEKGRPLVGPTGQLLNKALIKAGVDRAALYLTNATLCLPPLAATDAQKKKAAQCCLPRLTIELAHPALKGKPILALGAVATQALVETTYSITKIAGTYNETKVGGPHEVIPTIHPAAILRGGSGGDTSHSPDLMFWSLLYDIQKVAALAQGRNIRFREDILPVFSPEMRAVQVPNSPGARQFLLHFSQIVPGEARRALESVVLTKDEEIIDNQLVSLAHHATSMEVEKLMESIALAARALRFLAVDLETYTTNDHDPLEAPHAKIRCIGLATPHAGASFMWDLLTPRALRLLRSLLADTTLTKVFHNELYDKPVLAWNGFPVGGPTIDTMLLHHNAFPGLTHKLQAVAAQFFAIRPWKCLHGNVQVLLPDRSTVPIQEFVRKRLPEVLSYENGEVVSKTVTGWHDTHVPGQEWVRVRTGRCDNKYRQGLVVTPDHRVMTERGLVEARQLRIGEDRIAIDEPKFSPDQISATIGTLLGDSLLAVSRVYHKRPWDAQRASVRGGHANRELRNCKVASLPLGTACQRVPSHETYILGKKSVAADFFHYGTKWAFQYKDIAKYVYDLNWRRRITPAALRILGKRGLAMMYMDDGDLHIRNRSAGFATNGFPAEDVELFANWLREQYGAARVYPYKGKNYTSGYVALPVRATLNMLEDLRGYIHPAVGYKTVFQDPFIDVARGSGVHFLPITGVEPVRVSRQTPQDRYLADHRYCLTVEDTKLFFTNYGLVSNSDFREGDETAQELVGYNALDVLSTARLVAPLTACIKRSQAERTWQIDQEMAKVALRMHLVGVPIDRQVNRALAGHFEKMVAQSRRGIEGKAADPALQKDLFDRLAFEQAKRLRKSDPSDFIERHRVRVGELEAEHKKGKWSWLINSGEHVVAYLRAKGVNMPKVTEKGRTSTDKDVLESLSHLPEVRDLLTYRENQKLLSTFIDPMIYYMDRQDRVHPMWAVNAITGRWKADKPATMNWPKGDQIWPCARCLQWKEHCACDGFDKMKPGFESWSKIPAARQMVPNLRWQVRASKGKKLIAFDYKQLEARLIALYSGEPFLLDIFRSGKDIHDEFSKIVWPGWAGMNVDVRKELRDLTKRVEFAGYYGATVDTAYENIRKDKPQVKRQDIAAALNLINRQLTHVQAWHAQLIRDAMQKGEIRSAILGRRFVFPLGNADPTVLFNAPVQSAAADLIDLGLATFVQKKPKGAEPILQVHDSLVVECVENDLDKTRQAMLESFEQEHTIGETTVEFPIDLHTGDSWGEI